MHSFTILAREFHWIQVFIIFREYNGKTRDDVRRSNVTFVSDANLADADAILLLENIKISNYNNIDRLVGFNLEETLAVMKVFLSNF